MEPLIGKDIIYLDSVDSTNDYLKRLVEAGRAPRSGTMVLAKNQYKGRGCRGNVWIAEPGANLTHSYYVSVSMPVEKAFAINQMIGVAIHKFLTKLAPQESFYLKWPNDVICADRKIGGILIENFLHARNIKASILGIGLNVNQETFELDGSLPPVSLFMRTGEKYQVLALAQRLARSIDGEYKKMRANLLQPDYALELKHAYEAVLYQKEQENYFEDVKEKTTFKGRIVGVSELGELVVKTNHCCYRRFKHKEIKLLSA